MKKMVLLIFTITLAIILAGCSGSPELSGFNQQMTTEKETTPGEKEVQVTCIDYPYYNGLEDLAKNADYIIHGKVIDKTYEWRVVSTPAAELYLNPEDVPPVEEDLVTVCRVQVLDSFLPTADAGMMLEVLLYGGETETTIYRVEGNPQLSVDEEYVFFLSKSSLFENAGWPLNPAQGICTADTETIEALRVIAEHPITLISKGETIFPYQHFAYSGGWDGNGFICADGSSLMDEMEGLAAENRIPAVDYSQDFAVVAGDGVTTKEILLFDESFNELDTLWEITDLSRLEDGIYYVGIVATKEGKYIAEADRHEYTGWAFVFVLNKNG